MIEGLLQKLKYVIIQPIIWELQAGDLHQSRDAITRLIRSLSGKLNKWMRSDLITTKKKP